MIRYATLLDVPALAAMGARMHGESPRYRRLAYSAPKVERLLHAMIASDSALVLVALRESQLIGCALAAIDAEWFSEDRIAQELVVFVDRQWRGGLTAAKLISGVRAWAQACGAIYLQVGTTTGIDVQMTEMTAALYERIGFTRVGIGLEVEY